MNLPARNSDPLTSKLAAEHMVASGKIVQQQRVVLSAVRSFPDRTAFEIAIGARLCRFLVGRRLSELAANGDVVASGKDAKRTCSVTGRKAMTWAAVPVQLGLLS